MRQILVLIIFILLGIGLKAQNTSQTIEVPTLPATLILEWTPNPPEENVISYRVSVGTAATVNYPAANCTENLCAYSFIVQRTGNHGIGLSAVNSVGIGGNTLLTLTVTLPAVPEKPSPVSNIRVKVL